MSKPYAVECGDITEKHLEAFRQVQTHMEYFAYGKRTCHDACAWLVTQVHGLRHVRGRFDKGWEHSWLAFVDDEDTIIDPYPWACASGPILLTTKPMSPWQYLYREDSQPRQHPDGRK